MGHFQLLLVIMAALGGFHSNTLDMSLVVVHVLLFGGSVSISKDIKGKLRYRFQKSKIMQEALPRT